MIKQSLWWKHWWVFALEQHPELCSLPADKKQTVYHIERVSSWSSLDVFQTGERSRQVKDPDRWKIQTGERSRQVKGCLQLLPLSMSMRVTQHVSATEERKWKWHWWTGCAEPGKNDSPPSSLNTRRDVLSLNLHYFLLRQRRKNSPL